MNHRLSTNIRIIAAARTPEFNWLLDEKLKNVNEIYRLSLRKLMTDPSFILRLIPFDRNKVEGFLRKYQISKSTSDVYNGSHGNPLLLKFAAFGSGLKLDVRERCDRYINNIERMKTMILCALFDLSTLRVEDSLLEKMNILKEAYKLEAATLHKYSTGQWKTIHPGWDKEFFRYSLQLVGKATKLEREGVFRDLLDNIFTILDGQFIYRIIRILYELVTLNVLTLETVENIVSIPRILSDEIKCNIYAYAIGSCYFMLNKTEDALGYYDKGLKLFKSLDVLCDKGTILLTTRNHGSRRI